LIKAIVSVCGGLALLLLVAAGPADAACASWAPGYWAPGHWTVYGAWVPTHWVRARCLAWVGPVAGPPVAVVVRPYWWPRWRPWWRHDYW
jgi:hypothetical protein